MNTVKMVHRQIISMILILIATLAIVNINSQSLYKYEINIDHLEHPKKDLLIDYGTLRVKKYNRTTYTVDGYIDTLQPFSDEIWSHIEIFAEKGNDYQKIYSKNMLEMCSHFKNDEIMISQIIHLTSLAPEISKCPVPAGRIYFYNTHMPITRLPMEPIQMERGKLRFMLYTGDVLMSNISLYFMLTKKPFY